MRGKTEVNYFHLAKIVYSVVDSAGSVVDSVSFVVDSTVDSVDSVERCIVPNASGNQVMLENFTL